MKKTILTLVLMFVLQGLYAQTDLKMDFEAAIADFGKDPVGNVKKMDDNLRFLNGEGVILDKQKTLALAQRAAGGKSDSQVSDLRVKQSGTLGVVSGIRMHTLTLPSNLKMSWKDAFTYTFEWNNKAWIMTDMHHTKIDYNTASSANEMNIKKVIKDETDGYYEGNFDKANAQWSTKLSNEYQNQYIAPFVGQPYAKAETLQKLFEVAKKSSQKQEVAVDESDFEIRLNGKMAWATYNQKVTKKDGVMMQNQRQTRILERTNNDWKIVFLSGQDIK